MSIIHIGIGQVGEPFGVNPFWRLREDGWRGLIERHVKPAIDRGYNRFLLHNPFGTPTTGLMQFDQAVHSRTKAPWLYEDFASAWLPITQPTDSAAPCEVIAYIGTPEGDADFARRHGDPDAINLRVRDSTKWVFDAGMSIALDMASEAGDRTQTYGFAITTDASGVKVYIEPAWMAHSPHWRDFPAIVWESTYQKCKAAREHFDWDWIDTRGAELVRMIDEPPQGETWATARAWLPGVVAAILADGHTPMYGVLNAQDAEA